MAGEFYDWSLTAASNSNSDSTVNWAEGQLPSTVNGSARAMMAAIASWRDDINGSLTTAGSSNAYTLTANVGFTALATGLMVCFKANHTNTGAATLAVNSLTAKALRTRDDQALVANQIISGGFYVAVYNAAANAAAGAWVLTSAPRPSNPTIQRLTSGTSATYTTPAGCLWIRVRCVGGGSGGAGSGTTPGAAGAGGTTTFSGGTLSAGGGSAPSTIFAQAGGVASGGNIHNVNGNPGGQVASVATSPGGHGGSSVFGGGGLGGGAGANNGSAAPNSNAGAGGGGAGCAATVAPGGGGSAGGYVEHIILSPAATYTYTIGAGGAGGTLGTSGAAGGNGASGIIIVEEFYN